MAKKYYQQSITIAGQTATHLKTSVNWLLLLDVGDAIIVGGTRAKIQSVDSATSLTFDAVLPAGNHLADFEVSAANVFNTFESSEASASKTPLMAGERGVPGERGIPGERGLTGLRGEKGDKGAAGGMGLRGIKGDKGDPGAVGEKGDKGDPGVRGETGLQGIKGDKGSDGADGIPGGPVGPKGDVGSVGPTGNTGPRGAKGDQGDVGGSGPQGIMGLTGPAGTPGGRGPKGDVGPVGPPRVLENNLTSNNPAHALAAPQGKALKALIDAKPDKLQDLISVAGTTPGKTYQLEVDGQGNLSLNEFTEADVTNWKDGGESAPDKEWKFTPTGLNVRVYPQGLAVENAANPGYQAIITPDGLRTVHDDKESALKIGELVLDNGGQHPILAAPMALNVRPEYLDAYNASIGPSSLLTLEYLSENGAPPEKLPAPGRYVREQKADLSESWVIEDEPTAPGVYVREHQLDGKIAWKKKSEPPLEGLNFRERKADGTLQWSKYVPPDDTIPQFSPVAPYLPRRFVEHGGEIFWNEFAVAPGPFNAAQWHKFTAVENEIPEWAVNTPFPGPISVQHDGKIYHSEVDVPARAAFDPADWVHEPTEIWQANHQPPYHPNSLVYKDGRVRRAITTPTAATFEEGEWLGAEPPTSFRDFNEVTDYAEPTWIRHDGKVWWNPDPVAAGAFNETQWKNAGSDGGLGALDETRAYPVGAHVTHNAKLYKAKVNVPAHAFVASEWEEQSAALAEPADVGSFVRTKDADGSIGWTGIALEGGGGSAVVLDYSKRQPAISHNNANWYSDGSPAFTLTKGGEYSFWSKSFVRGTQDGREFVLELFKANSGTKIIELDRASLADMGAISGVGTTSVIMRGIYTATETGPCFLKFWYKNNAPTGHWFFSARYDQKQRYAVIRLNGMAGPVHHHANAVPIAKVGENGEGKMTFDGQPVSSTSNWGTATWG